MSSRDRSAQLHDLRTKGLTADARERTLPLSSAFATLLPTVQRGSVVACEGPAAVSLALAVAAGPSAAGAWVGVAGLSSLGLAAAAECGVDLARLVAVREPGGDRRLDGLHWAELLGAMVDGFDVLLLGPGLGRVGDATVRRVVARLRARGAVAVTVGLPAFGADLSVRATGVRWQGLGEGHGVARSRVVHVEVAGRRMPRSRVADLLLPGPDGRVRRVDEVVSAVSAEVGSAEVGSAEAMSTDVVVPLRRTG